MQRFRSPEAYISFPAVENPKQTLHVTSSGIRVNGLWVVRANLPPPVRYTEAPLIGQIMLDLGIQDPAYRHLEPSIVNREAHMWVSGQAEAAGLRVVHYEKLTPPPEPGMANADVMARYVIMQAIPNLAAQ